MKIRRKVLITLLPLLLACGGLGIWYVRSDLFQKFVRASLVSRIEKATGLKCGIEHLEFDIFRGRFRIAGFSLSPRNAVPGLFNVTVEEARATLSISSFWHLRIRLAELSVTRPRVELIPGQGTSSSWNPEEFLTNLKVSLRLEAAKVEVRDGWFRANERSSPFQVSLDGLDCEIRYSKKLPSYSIRLRYGRSRIFWEERDFVHGLDLNADVSMQGVSIDFYSFQRGATVLTGSGSMKNWNSPVLQIHAAGNLDARDLRLATPSLYEGRGTIAVIADLRSDKDGIHSTGKFTARSGGYRKMAYKNVSGTYEIRDDVLHLRNVSGKIAEGNFQVDAEIQLREANKDPNRVFIKTKNVPVIDAGRLLNLPLMNFENTADSLTTLTWYGSKELRADCDAVLHGMPHSSSGQGRSTLLDGNIRFTYFDTGILMVDSGNLNSPYTSVQASGGRDSLFHVQMSTSRIAEPFELIAGFSPPVADLLIREPDLRDMAGRFDFSGNVQIQSSSDVTYDGSITVQNGRWRSYKVDTLSTHAAFNPPQLDLRTLSIRTGTQRIEGDFHLELSDQGQIPAFGFKGRLDQVSIAGWRDFGIETSGVSGSLSGSGSVQYERGSWEGDGKITVENGNYGAESFDSARAHLALHSGQLRISEAEAKRGGARLNVEGLVGLDSRQLNLTTRLQGFLMEQIELLQKKDLPVQGRVGLSGTLTGTIDKPAFAGNFDVASLRYDSRDLGSGKGSLEFQNGKLRGNARIRSDFGDMAFQADVATGTGFPGKVTMEFDNLDIQKLVSAEFPPYLQDLSTALEGKLEAQGNFEDLASLRIRGEVDGAHFKIRDYELHNEGRLRFTAVNRRLTMDSVRFVGDGTNLLLSGTVPLDGSPQLDLALNGNLNLELLDGVEKKLHASGSVMLNIRANGSRGDPQVIGQASLRDAMFDYKDLPFRFSGMQGDMVFSRNLVRFEKIRGSAASGTIELSGIVEHRNAVLRSINMAIMLRRARLPYPKDFRSVGDADLVLSGSGDAQVLSGEIDVTRMEYLRGFNLLEQLASRAGDQSGPLTTDPFMLGLRLNIEIRSDNGLSIDNELARVRAAMRLTLRGTAAYPSLTGRVEATEGTIFFRGSRFEISRASADFVDRNRIKPVLEIRAEADVKTYRLILDAVGEIDHLNLNVTSDPPMSTVDILSLLTTGKEGTGTGTSQHESQMAGMSAASVLSENLTGVIGKRVQRIFGLESFRVDPFLAGAENDPTARITISERISKDLVVTFSRNLTTNQEQIVIIEYDVGKNVSVVATRDENGKFGLDFRLHKHFR
jgi:hypothetical protein